jgi:hypothetical protein
MSKSAFLEYDPLEHTEQYGWLWTEDDTGEHGWHMIFTIEDDGDLRTYFVADDQTEDADAYAKQPFMLVSEPSAPGNEPPGFILTLDDHRGVRLIFSWGVDGIRGDHFAETIRAAVEHALAGCQNH